MLFELSGTSEMEYLTKKVGGSYREQFSQKDPSYFHLRGSEFGSDLKHSGKEYIYLIIDTLHMK